MRFDREVEMNGYRFEREVMIELAREFDELGW